MLLAAIVALAAIIYRCRHFFSKIEWIAVAACLTAIGSISAVAFTSQAAVLMLAPKSSPPPLLAT